MIWHEEPVVFQCEGSCLLGITAIPDRPVETGILIIVGGPQYRAGSHRQFTLLARQLANNGISSFRFDYRGMGDSEGEKIPFDQIIEDIKVAIDTFLKHVPAIRYIALWGLCDAACAAMIYGHTDLRIRQLILLNPWLQSSLNVERIRLKQYYPSRFGQLNFWIKLISFQTDIPVTIRGIINDLKTTFHLTGKSTIQMVSTVNEEMLVGLKKFGGQVLFIMSEEDLTAKIFLTHKNSDSRWQEACRKATFLNISGADHTFSTWKLRDQVAQATVDSVLLPSYQEAEVTTDLLQLQAALCTDLTRLTRSDHESLQKDWITLETVSDASFFQSWTWIESWLEALPDYVEIYRLSVWHGEDLVGIGLFGKAAQVRHKLIHSRVLWLSESGNSNFDTLTIEHNNLLIRREWEEIVWPAAIGELIKHKQEWDEVRISGITNIRSINSIKQYAKTRGLITHTEYNKPYFWVDLEEVRSGQGDYLNVLSRNTRHQIKRSMKLYEEKGPLELSLAGSNEEALLYLEQLKQLHQSYWNKKGYPGAFSNEFTNNFHRSLVTNGLGRNQIQLIKILAGETVVGILYNFIYHNQVCNYQAGLMYEDNQKLKPGLVCHSLAIEMNIADGNISYDFLMGENQYKRSLSTQDKMMFWLTIRQPKVRFLVENIAQRAKNRLHEAFRAHDNISNA